MTDAPVDPVSDAWAAFEVAIGHRFRDPSLLERSLAHRSYCAEHPEVTSNERLEFLGDSVLGLSVTRCIYDRYGDQSEGELAKLRAAVVSAETLAEVATEIGLGEVLLLGRGEDSSGGRRKESILSDAMEAVIAGVYLDAGWSEADALVLRMLGDRIDEEALGPGGRDYKTRLQELAAHTLERIPRYRVSAEGPDHAKWFHATVTLGGVPWGTGEGRTKKQAEQAAAHVAWQALEEQSESAAGGESAHAGAT